MSRQAVSPLRQHHGHRGAAGLLRPGLGVAPGGQELCARQLPGAGGGEKIGYTSFLGGEASHPVP